MLETAKQNFRPELLNRVEEIIVFRQLQEEDIRQILEIEVAKVAARLKSREIVLSVQPSAFAFLLAKGYDRQYGARQLRRVVERYLENVLAEEILRGKIANGEIIEVEGGEDRLVFRPPSGEAAKEPLEIKPEPVAKPATRRKKDPGAE
jgi:ATP-dependent Clp protease ATP-binding subunit ClpC